VAQPERKATAGAEFAAALSVERDRDEAEPLAGQLADRQVVAAHPKALVQSELQASKWDEERLAAKGSGSPEQSRTVDRRLERPDELAPVADVAMLALAECPARLRQYAVTEGAEFPAMVA
jgi:hypothetical protein